MKDKTKSDFEKVVQSQNTEIFLDLIPTSSSMSKPANEDVHKEDGGMDNEKVELCFLIRDNNYTLMNYNNLN